MVKLVRTSSILKDWEKAWEVLKGISEHIKKNYSEVKDSYFMFNITGRIDEVHWVMTFDSLADEERFALGVVEDRKYIDAMTEGPDLFTAPIDKLYRKVGDPGN